MTRRIFTTEQPFTIDRIHEVLLSNWKRRIRLFWLSWGLLFVIAIAVDRWNPYGVPTVVVALIRVVINVLIVPLVAWTGFYFLCGRWQARRFRLILKFIAANWHRPDAIAARGRGVR